VCEKGSEAGARALLIKRELCSRRYTQKKNNKSYGAGTMFMKRKDYS